MFVLTPAEMRAADAEAVADVGDVALMRRAGAALAARVRAYADSSGTEIVAFAGPGNNGGDGFAALAELAGSHDGYRCIVYADPSQGAAPGRADAEQRAAAAGVSVRPFPDNDAAAEAAVAAAAVVIDAIFGTGTRLPLNERYGAAVRVCDARRRLVIAADVPTGIDAATGAVEGDAVWATETVAFGAVKPGLLLGAARAHAGLVRLADIGISDSVLRKHARTYSALDDSSFLAALPQRTGEADKRSAGAPLLIAGSKQFPGAAVLCARAAARAGAGYVTVITAERAAPALRAHLVEQVVVTIPDAMSANDAIAYILDVASRNGSIGIGPGLGLDDRTGAIVRGVLERTALPAVADASALFHLAKSLGDVRGKPLVLTPHAGEFARLSGKGTVAPEARTERLREFVDRTGITTLLKGNATLVYDGNRMHINRTGTNALATAGTGDVLTGIISTLLSQGLAPVDAATVGAYWHGLAGRYAERKRRRGVIAGDVADSLGAALPHQVP